jgi:hypothetical protein
VLYIENEGALFRGPARSVPLEVWNKTLGEWAPYALAGKPKDISWGTVISEEEAEEMMLGSSTDRSTNS